MSINRSKISEIHIFMPGTRLKKIFGQNVGKTQPEKVWIHYFHRLNHTVAGVGHIDPVVVGLIDEAIIRMKSFPKQFWWKKKLKKILKKLWKLSKMFWELANNQPLWCFQCVVLCCVVLCGTVLCCAAWCLGFIEEGVNLGIFLSTNYFATQWCRKYGNIYQKL